MDLELFWWARCAFYQNWFPAFASNESKTETVWSLNHFFVGLEVCTDTCLAEKCSVLPTATRTWALKVERLARRRGSDETY